jgi:hypothetical protein
MNWTDSSHANLDAAGRWTPGLGDPSVMGWVTVAVYLLAAWLTWRVARQARADGGAWRLWATLAVVLLALGVNKQLDLQSLFTQVGRDLALAQGWYQERRLVQGVFIGALAAGALAVGWWLRTELREPAQRLAGLGLCVLLAFVVMRAASFHHMDQLINFSVVGVRMNWVLELSGLVIILVAARRALRGQGAGSGAAAAGAARFGAAGRASGGVGSAYRHPDVSPDDPPLIAWLRVRLAPLRAVIARRQGARQRPAHPASAQPSPPTAAPRRAARGEVTRVPRRP